MKVAVTDANIFIDLIHLDLIAELFRINIIVYTTIEIFYELKSSEQEIIMQFKKEGKLNIESILEIHKGNSSLIIPSSRLSYSDISVLYLASYLKANIISGDSLLKKIALENNFEVYGILWIMDTMVNLKIISSALACEKLEALLKYNKRMSLDESSSKIKIWQSL